MIVCHFVAVKYLSSCDMGGCCLLIRNTDMLPLILIKAIAEIGMQKLIRGLSYLVHT